MHFVEIRMKLVDVSRSGSEGRTSANKGQSSAVVDRPEETDTGWSQDRKVVNHGPG